jgi:hypothetical protein
LALISEPELLLTTYSSGGKKASNVCSAKAKPTGSYTASLARGPRVSSPGGGGGLCKRDTNNNFGRQQKSAAGCSVAHKAEVHRFS